MTDNQIITHAIKLLDIEDETPVKGRFRAWLARQFSPEKNSENRRVNNREEFKVFRSELRSFIPLAINYVITFLLIFFLNNIGILLTLVVTFAFIGYYAIQGLKSVRRGMSDRIHSNKLKFLRLNSEAARLLKLIPDDADHDDVLEAFKEIDSELKSLNNSDKTSFGFISKAFTVGPLTLLALAYLLNLLTSMDPKDFIEGNKMLGSALGYLLAMGLILAFINDYVVAIRTIRSEGIAQIIAIAQEAYTRSLNFSPDSTK